MSTDTGTPFGPGTTQIIRGRIGVLSTLPKPPEDFYIREMPARIDDSLMNELSRRGIVEHAGRGRPEGSEPGSGDTVYRWRLTDKAAREIERYQSTLGAGLPCCEFTTTVKWQTVADPDAHSYPYQCPECGARHARSVIEAALERERERGVDSADS